MSTLEERKQKLNKRIAEIDKTYTGNIEQATRLYQEAETEAIRIIESRDFFGKNKEKRLLIIDKLNDAEMTRFVNHEFSFLISLIRDLGIAILELKDDLEKVSSSVNVNLPKIETHHEVFLALAESLEKKKKEDELAHLKKEEDQKKYHDLIGKMYG